MSQQQSEYQSNDTINTSLRGQLNELIDDLQEEGVPEDIRNMQRDVLGHSADDARIVGNRYEIGMPEEINRTMTVPGAHICDTIVIKDDKKPISYETETNAGCCNKFGCSIF